MHHDVQQYMMINHLNHLMTDGLHDIAIDVGSILVVSNGLPGIDGGS